MRWAKLFFSVTSSPLSTCSSLESFSLWALRGYCVKPSLAKKKKKFWLFEKNPLFLGCPGIVLEFKIFKNQLFKLQHFRLPPVWISHNSARGNLNNRPSRQGTVSKLDLDVIFKTAIFVGCSLTPLKVLKIFCEIIFGFLEQSANRDSKWFSDT